MVCDNYFVTDMRACVVIGCCSNTILPQKRAKLVGPHIIKASLVVGRFQGAALLSMGLKHN